MICPHCEPTGERWSEIREMGFVCRCRHPENSGNQGYVRAEVPAGELRPSGHCSPRCVFLAGSALAEQWKRENDAYGGSCCGG